MARCGFGFFGFITRLFLILGGRNILDFILDFVFGERGGRGIVVWGL